jgi:hypothetical protein
MTRTGQDRAKRQIAILGAGKTVDAGTRQGNDRILLICVDNQ